MKRLVNWWHESFDSSNYDEDDWDSWPWPGQLLLHALLGVLWVFNQVVSLKTLFKPKPTVN